MSSKHVSESKNRIFWSTDRGRVHIKKLLQETCSASLQAKPDRMNR